MEMRCSIYSHRENDCFHSHFQRNKMNKFERQWYKCGSTLLALGMYELEFWRRIQVIVTDNNCIAEIQRPIQVDYRNGMKWTGFLWTTIELAIFILKISPCSEWNVVGCLKIVLNFGEKSGHICKHIPTRMNYSILYIIMARNKNS